MLQRKCQSPKPDCAKIGRYCSRPRSIKVCLNSEFIMNELRCLSQIRRLSKRRSFSLKSSFPTYPVEPSSAPTPLNVNPQVVKFKRRKTNHPIWFEFDVIASQKWIPPFTFTTWWCCAQTRSGKGIGHTSVSHLIGLITFCTQYSITLKEQNKWVRVIRKQVKTIFGRYLLTRNFSLQPPSFPSTSQKSPNGKQGLKWVGQVRSRG
jgi:hypothetical protein